MPQQKPMLLLYRFIFTANSILNEGNLHDRATHCLFYNSIFFSSFHLLFSLLKDGLQPKYIPFSSFLHHLFSLIVYPFIRKKRKHQHPKHQKFKMPNIDLAFKPVSDHAGRMVESSWKRILAIAQNHVQEFEEQEGDIDGFQRSSNDTRRSRSTENSSVVNHQIHSSDQSQTDFYDRERHMVHALDTLFTLAYEGRVSRNV